MAHARMICVLVGGAIFMTGCAQTQSRNRLARPLSVSEHSIPVDDASDPEPPDTKPVLTRVHQSAKETAKEVAEGAVFNVMFLVVMPAVMIGATPVLLVREIVDSGFEKRLDQSGFARSSALNPASR
jgi:hypothetical protein